MRFLDYLQESINDKGILKAIFFTGSPGAGKSIISSKIGSGQIEPRIVNTDKPYEFLVHSYGGTFTGEQDSFVDEAIRLTKKQLVQYVNGMLPLFIDGTSNNPSSLFRRVGILESLGYDVGMVFVETDLETALSRASARERTVPEEFIKKAHETVTKNKQFYKSKFGTNFLEYDNSSDVIDDAAILAMYRRSYQFFTRPVENPIGKQIIETLRERKQKYLSPSIISNDELTRRIEGWY
jgi:tRNA uridine 5-carbamoylmethylation protein Kti12